jgi:hypothetical protein
MSATAIGSSISSAWAVTHLVAAIAGAKSQGKEFSATHSASLPPASRHSSYSSIAFFFCLVFPNSSVGIAYPIDPGARRNADRAAVVVDPGGDQCLECAVATRVVPGTRRFVAGVFVFEGRAHAIHGGDEVDIGGIEIHAGVEDGDAGVDSLIVFAVDVEVGVGERADPLKRQ